MPNFSWARAVFAIVVTSFLLLPGPTPAQEPTLESRLREALRKTTADLHAAQDQNEQLQADLAKAKGQIASLTQENSDLKTKLDTMPPPALTPPPPPPTNDTALAELRAALAAANARNTTLQNQVASADAAARARVSEAQAQANAAAKTLATTQNLVNACRSTNHQLLAVATEILDTYKNESFRSVWLRSYEPVLGLDRVKLQNIMQAFENKLLDHALPAGTP